jgi:chitin disaccharide deacetylase
MIRLVITADDLGVNTQRSHGIFQCAEFGVVTNASLLANGSDSDAAARHARERGVPTGLHLNLTEEYPVSRKEDVSSLVDANGRFFDRDRLRELFKEGKVERGHLEREVRSQVDWFFDAHGQAPTHVDGHHHIHVEPAVAETLIPVMERYGLRFVRIPCELPLPPFGYEVDDDKLARTAALNERALAARELYAAHGIGSTDHFRGLTLAGNASLKNLRHVIGRLLDGVTELMVHPGSPAAYGTPFDLDPQRQTELRMLLDDSIPKQLADKKVTLCSWADI